MLFHSTWPASSSERIFTLSLMLSLFFFAAASVSLIISPAIAVVGRWIGMTIALGLGFLWRFGSSKAVVVRQRPVDLLIWGLMFGYFLSALSSVAEQKSILYLGVCFMQIILFTMLSRSLSLESWRLLFRFLMILCVIVSTLGLFGYVRAPDRFIVQGRLAGLGNANAIGMIAMVGLLVSLSNLLFDRTQLSIRKFRWKNFYFLSSIACLTALVLSGSRSSVGGTTSGILVVLFFALGVSRVLLAALLFMPMALSFSALFENSGLEQILARGLLRDSGQDLLFSRRDQWAQALEVFEGKPLLGAGYGVHYPDGIVIDGSGYHGLVASVGVIGATFFFGIAFWLIVRLFRLGGVLIKRKNQSAGNRELLAVGGGCFIALFVQGVGEPWMLGPGSITHVIYWLSVGACISAIYLSHERSVGARLPRTSS